MEGGVIGKTKLITGARLRQEKETSIQPVIEAGAM